MAVFHASRFTFHAALSVLIRDSDKLAHGAPLEHNALPLALYRHCAPLERKAIPPARGWVTQPLRIEFPRLPPSAIYKHVAPLGLWLVRYVAHL